MKRCRWVLAGSLAVASAAPSSAGEPMVDCSEPRVFPDARVNVVVLPYTSSVPGESTRATGTRLSLLVQMNALASIMKFGSVGTVQLVEGYDRPRCTPEFVWDRLQHLVRPGNGVVMVWGKLFENEGHVFEQSFLQFARIEHGAEALNVQAAGRTFTATLTAQAFSFPAQTLSREEIARIEELTAGYAGMRSAPDETSSPVEVRRVRPRCIGCDGLITPNSYVVLGEANGWMRVLDESGATGYLKLAPPFTRGVLADKMPEIHMIEGVTGYLESSILEKGARVESAASAAEQASDALRAYARAVVDTPPVTAAAVAAQLDGLLASARSGPSSADRAVALFERARQQLPADGSARNLLAVATLQRWILTSAPTSQSMLADGLLSAAILDPARTTALENLRTFYEVTLADAWKAPVSEKLDPDDTARRLELVRATLKARAAHSAR